ncbi:MAG: hypothetical protein K6G22_12900 [Lachnospiraceae bacterium]|nr:hypothetical protein [Lachnospiraceae bacterium]
MNSRANLIIIFGELLEKIVTETMDTEYTQTCETARRALSADDGLYILLRL